MGSSGENLGTPETPPKGGGEGGGGSLKAPWGEGMWGGGKGVTHQRGHPCSRHGGGLRGVLEGSRGGCGTPDPPAAPPHPTELSAPLPTLRCNTQRPPPPPGGPQAPPRAPIGPAVGPHSPSQTSSRPPIGLHTSPTAPSRPSIGPHNSPRSPIGPRYLPSPPIGLHYPPASLQGPRASRRTPQPLPAPSQGCTGPQKPPGAPRLVRRVPQPHRRPRRAPRGRTAHVLPPPPLRVPVAAVTAQDRKCRSPEVPSTGSAVRRKSHPPEVPFAGSSFRPAFASGSPWQRRRPGLVSRSRPP